MKNKYPPSKYPYIVQHVGYPVAGRSIGADEWSNKSYHTSAHAAFKAISRYRAHLDYAQWDDHYQVIDRKGNRIVRLAEWYYVTDPDS